MRYDDIGLFWEDLPAVKGERRAAVMPPIPDTGWEIPKEFPNLSAAPYIALDTETKDLGLKQHGPGYARGAGHIVGVSLSTEGRAWYFPMRHEVEPENNMDPDHVLRYLDDTLSNPRQDKVGANLIYDLGWLREEKVRVAGKFIDVQYAEALLEESARVGLEHLGRRYLGRGKETDHLKQWCLNYYGGSEAEWRKNIYRAPARLVGPYAEEDALMPAEIIHKQYRRLMDEQLLDLFDLECGLIPLLLDMRFNGVRVNTDRLDEAETEMLIEVDKYQKQLNEMVGFECNPNSGKEDLPRAFETLGLRYPVTKAGNPSFTKPFLEKHDHPIGPLITEIRKLTKTVGTFFNGLRSNVNGRVHGQFHPLRTSGYGARSGRFSASQPNLQNIPSRDPVIGPLLRGLFLPEVGHKGWRSYDYSQIEYIYLAHFAVGPGSDELREIFRNDPNADFHKSVGELIHKVTGITLKRKPTKTINFGLCYGMGKPKLARSLGLSRSEANTLFDAYHSGAPFVKATASAVSDLAETTGLVKTILGRRCRFDQWGPAVYIEDAAAYPYERALVEYGQVKRAYLHKSLNRLLQGSAADEMKKAMKDCYEAGVFQYTGIPLLTVHDELNFSDDGSAEANEAFKEMHHIMENCIQLRVPVRVDAEAGPDWGHLEKMAA